MNPRQRHPGERLASGPRPQLSGDGRRALAPSFREGQRHRVIWVFNVACPSRCLHCDIESQQGARLLDEEQVRQICAQVSGAGFLEVTFVGGEPLLSPLFSVAVKALKDAGVTVAVFTGGLPGDPERWVRLLDGVDRLVLSLDAGDDASNDRIRGRSGTTADVLHLGGEARRRFPALDISVNTVVTRYAADDLEAVWERVRTLRPTAWALTLAGDNFTGNADPHRLDRAGIEAFYLKTVPALAARLPLRECDLVVLPVPLPWLAIGLPPRQWRDAARTPELAAEFDRFARGDYNEAFSARHGCPLVGLDATIGPAGEVWPCSQAPVLQPRFVVGDLRRDALEHVLAGPELAAFKEGVPHPPCKRCWAPSNVPSATLRRVLSAFVNEA